MRGSLPRLLVLTAFVVAAVVAAAGPAVASGPSSLGVSGWQVYSDTSIIPNQDSAQIHGDPGEYAAAPAIPAQDDPGWADCGPTSPFRYSPYGSGPLCPNATSIGMQVGSILSGCWANLNFTYFQALVSIPEGTNISQFSVNMHGADDGARISLVNSAHPDGITPSGGYIYQLTTQSTGNLADDVVAGEVNRVIITQVDDCATGNDLQSALISLNGTVIPPAPKDTTPPVIAQAPDVTAEATGPDGAAVSYATPAATDDTDGTDPVSCSPASGSTFPLGSTTVSCSSTDAAGNTGYGSFNVVVKDTTPPSVAAVPDVTAEATGPDGAAVSYTAPTASDAVDGSDAVSCSPASGSMFPLGSTTVSCSSTDAAGNTGNGSFNIVVQDTTPPSIAFDSQSPAANSYGWNSGPVTLTWTCTDLVSGSWTVTQTLSSEGANQSATGTCTDGAGNSSSDTEGGVNIDLTNPTLAPSVSPNPVAVGASASASAHGSDALSGIASSSCGSVSTANAGVFTVSCTVTDRAGNSATASATYTVYKALGAGSNTCTGIVGGSGGSLNVPDGASCTLLPGTSLSGSVTVGTGSTFTCNGATIAQDLHAVKAAGLGLMNCTIGHDLQVEGLQGRGPGVGGDSYVCGTTVGHDFHLVNDAKSASRMDIGGAPDCSQGNQIGHDLQVTNNDNALVIDNNTVGHDLDVENNDGGTTVGSNNTAGHALTNKHNS